MERIMDHLESLQNVINAAEYNEDMDAWDRRHGIDQDDEEAELQDVCTMMEIGLSLS